MAMKFVWARRHVRGGVAVAGVALLATCLAACGNSSHAHSADSAGGGSNSGPLTVGFANMTTGTISFPGSAEGAVVAQDYINHQLGGINGHQLKLVQCDLQNTIQAAQACGQKFAADSSMPFALATINTSGNTSFSSALGAQHKPVLGAIAITSADESDPNTYWAYSNSGAAEWGKIASAVSAAGGVDETAYLGTQGAQSTISGIDNVKSNLTPGIKFVSVTAQANSPDYLATLKAANLTDKSVLLIDAPIPNACSSIAKDLSTLGVHPKAVVTSTICLTNTDVQANPSLYQNWIQTTSLEEPIPGSSTQPKDIQLFEQAWKKYGKGDITAGEAVNGWGLVMTMYDILKSAGTKDITGAAFTQDILNFKGAVSLGGGGTLNCPGSAPKVALCNDRNVVYTVKNGQLILGSPYVEASE